MKTSAETLSSIAIHYPEAISALPKGWRFINFGEKIGKNDKFWTVLRGRNVFDNVSSVGRPYNNTFLPIIRRVRSPKKTEQKPLNLNNYEKENAAPQKP